MSEGIFYTSKSMTDVTGINPEHGKIGWCMVEDVATEHIYARNTGWVNVVTYRANRAKKKDQNFQFYLYRPKLLRQKIESKRITGRRIYASVAGSEGWSMY